MKEETAETSMGAHSRRSTGKPGWAATGVNTAAEAAQGVWVENNNPITIHINI